MAVPFGTTNDAVAPSSSLGLVAFGVVAVDLWGVVTLCSCLAVVAAYWGACTVSKVLRQRCQMPAVAAGQYRLAATRGQVARLEAIARAVPRGFDVDAPLGGFTALHAACVSGHADAVLWLCQKGADVAALKDDGWRDTALHYAASSGSMECVQALLAFGAEAGLPNALGTTPASAALSAGHPAVASYLEQVTTGSVVPPPREEYAGRDLLSSDAVKSALDSMDVQQVLARGWEGWGTPGTKPKKTTRLFRPLAVITQVLATFYIVWRALRTFKPGWWYFYSIPFYVAEFAAFTMSNIFMMSMWNQIERPARRVADMLQPHEFPHCDVFVVTYSEPVEVVEPTVIAALNLNWPGSKLTVHILDDGRRPEMAKMVRRLRFQLAYMQRDAAVEYVGRDKSEGVPHHAKAGNINSCLLKEGQGKGEYVLVLDCDMIVHPDFLQCTVGHFYALGGEQGKWVPKEKAAFLQTAQDFWNVERRDPLVHCARFFYGPMLQGRDGIGACPCCGTGVVFRRDALVSIGGQAYGSITEDYNTALTLMSSGFATMYMDVRLMFGMAPDDVHSTMTQRLRYAMGALQILIRDNPLKLPGLTVLQALLFWESCAQHFLAISTIFMAIVPVLYLFTQFSPLVVAHLWEFAAVFGPFYLANRITMWWAHRGCEGSGSQELWRGSQQWVWISPNHLKAIWKVFLAESWLAKKLFSFKITFHVTAKSSAQSGKWEATKKTLWCIWPHLTYLAAFFAGSIYWIIMASQGQYNTWQIMVLLSAMCWSILIALCIWPLVSTLLPRRETEKGWRIKWIPFQDPAAAGERRRRRQRRQPSRMLDRLSSAMSSVRSWVQGGLSVAGPQKLDGGSSLGGKAIGTEQVAGKPQAASVAEPTPGAAALVTASTISLQPAQHEQLEQAGSTYRTVTLRGRLGRPPTLSPFGASCHIEASTIRAPEQDTRPPGDSLPPSGAARSFLAIPMPSLATVASSLRSQYTLSPGHSMGSVGRVALPEHTRRVREASALITSVVLPERDEGGGGSMTAVVVHPAEGSLGPAASLPAEQLAGSLSVESLSWWDTKRLDSVGQHLAESTPTSRPSHTTTGSQAGSPPAAELSGEQSAALGMLDTLTGASPSVVLSQQRLRVLPSPGSIGPGSPGRLGGVQLVPLPEGREPDLDAGPPSATRQRQQNLSVQLVRLASALSPASASMLRQGSSMVVPVVPGSVFDHTIAAQPNFQSRQTPPSNYMFILVNGAILVFLAVGSWLDVEYNPARTIFQGN